MTGKSIPLPEEYIVWRDNRKQYHVAKRPPDLHAPMPSRTRAVQWLWGEFGREFADRKQSSGRSPVPTGLEPGNHTVWHTHFGEVSEESEEENNREPAKR